MILNQSLSLLAGLTFMTSCIATPLLDGEVLRIGQSEFRVQAPEGEGPVTLVDPTTIQFTVEPGDQWEFDQRIGKPKERAEISGQERIAFGSVAEAKVDLRITGQSDGSQGRWMTISQLHGPNRKTIGQDSALGSPPLAVQLRGEQLIFVARGGNGLDNEMYRERIGSIAADFGNWHRYDIRVAMGVDGRVTVDRDGETVIDWSGPVGYDAGDGLHYWKFGIYRSDGWEERSRVDLRIACAGSDKGCELDTQ
jgi:hypothetical protein